MASDPASLRRRAAGLGVLVLLAVYLAFPDKVYVFDGIMFSGIIERAVTEWRGELFNRRHLLFNPAMMLLRDLLGALGWRCAAYPMIQKVNAVLGVCAAALFHRLVLRLSRDELFSAAAAGLLAFSAAFWSRATEGQVYMALTLGAVASAWAAVNAVEDPGPLGGFILAAALAAAVLFHAFNAALVPMAAAALWLAAGPGKRARIWGPLAACCAAVALPFAWAFRLRDADSLRAFLFQATEFFTPAGGDSWGHLLGRLLHGAATPASLAGYALRQFAGSIVVLRIQGSLPALAAAALWTASAAALRGAWPRLDARQRRGVGLLLAGAGCHVLLDCFWGGGLFFGAFPVACWLAATATALSRLGALEGALRRRAAAAGAAALVAGLAGWNLWAGILPQSRLENNRDYRMALFVRRHTVGSSWVVISGLGWGPGKVYLAYFAKRSREVLEYFLNSNPKPAALEKFHAFLAGNAERGIPLYALSDLLDDKTALDAVRSAYGVEPEEIRGAFGPGRFVLMAASDDPVRVYLFIPDVRQELLYASLSYSVLTETEEERLHETIRVMRGLANGMTPARRRLAAETLEATGYGSRLLFEGFAPYMNAEFRRQGQERMREVAKMLEAGAPEIQLRLGNLFLYLRDKERTRRAWEKAYAGSKDPQLAARLAALKGAGARAVEDMAAGREEVERLILEAKAHYAKRELDAAGAAFTEALVLDPASFWAYNGRGAVYYALGRPADAAADYSKALALKPDYPSAYSNRGAALASMGRAREAVADCSRALALAPEMSSAYLNRAEAHLLLKERALALQDLAKACSAGLPAACRRADALKAAGP